MAREFVTRANALIAGRRAGVVEMPSRGAGVEAKRVVAVAKPAVGAPPAVAERKGRQRRAIARELSSLAPPAGKVRTRSAASAATSAKRTMEIVTLRPSLTRAEAAFPCIAPGILRQAEAAEGARSVRRTVAFPDVARNSLPASRPPFLRADVPRVA